MFERKHMETEMWKNKAREWKNANEEEKGRLPLESISYVKYDDDVDLVEEEYKAQCRLVYATQQAQAQAHLQIQLQPKPNQQPAIMTTTQTPLPRTNPN